MSKKPQIPEKPMQEVIAIRALPEFKEATIKAAEITGQPFSDYVREAINQSNERVNNVPE